MPARVRWFATIAAEPQRPIPETCSAFVQNFMPELARPDVDVLAGLTTAILDGQERIGANLRCTVGTATDAHAILRMLSSRLGTSTGELLQMSIVTEPPAAERQKAMTQADLQRHIAQVGANGKTPVSELVRLAGQPGRDLENRVSGQWGTAVLTPG